MCLGYGILHMRREDLARALPVLERGLEVARRGSIYLYLFSIAAAAGRAQVLTGRVKEGLALITECVNEAAARFSALGHAVRLAWLAEALLVAGEPEPAWERAQQALDYSRRFKEKGQEAWTLHLLGEISGQRDPGDLESAERFYREALVIAGPLGMRPAMARCQLGLGELHARGGRGPAAQEHLRLAFESFRDMGIASLQARAERQLDASPR
jgi:tetratricopeptide (TPR) repeat protein